jgi:hypothetical protein
VYCAFALKVLTNHVSCFRDFLVVMGFLEYQEKRV